MGNVEEGLRLLDQAEADLKTAKDCLEDGNFYACAFFSQQTAEKALKGLLYARGYRAIVTHSVFELLEELGKTNTVFEKLLHYGRELDRHYISSCYPNVYPKGPAYKYYTRGMAETCLNYAGSILSEAKRLLRGQTST